MWKKLIVLTGALIILAISSSMSYEQQTIIPTLREVLVDKPFEHQLSYLKIPYWGEIISVETRGYYHFVEFLIRKATHFVGFGCIALILYWLFPKKMHFKGQIIIACIFLLASIDEIRQGLTPGRTMTFQDVLLDTAGAAFFVGLITLFKKQK